MPEQNNIHGFTGSTAMAVRITQLEAELRAARQSYAELHRGWESYVSANKELTAQRDAAREEIERLRTEFGNDMAQATDAKYAVEQERDAGRALLVDCFTALKECAEDLGGEVEDRYQAIHGYPSMEAKYQRDIAPVKRANEIVERIEAALKEKP